MKTEPFLKWAGGKRWLAPKIADLAPEKYERYIEPFLGSGAVFFHLSPEQAILSDTNEELINAYACIKTDAQSIEKKLKVLDRDHSSAQYYRIRGSKPRSPIGRASRFIYLNRTCFNGLYRVNRAGAFNVPIGTKTAVAFSEGTLQRVSNVLRNVELRVSDFEPIVDEASAGDLLYVDPPYTVRHNNNGFLKYNSHLFSWSDQLRLAQSVSRATARGVTVVLSNANHESVRALYRGFGRHTVLRRTTILAGSAADRGETTELLVVSP